MTKEDAQKKIQELTSQAEVLIREAEKVADEHEVNFEFSIAYGMGGWYIGSKKEREELGLDEEGAWSPSSHSC